MNLRYTKRAVKQIDAALAYIRERSPRGADNVRHRLITIGAMLRQHPQAGHPTSREGVRRISIAPYPYVIDYRLTAGEIVVLRFRHTARRPVV